MSDQGLPVSSCALVPPVTRRMPTTNGAAVVARCRMGTGILMAGRDSADRGELRLRAWPPRSAYWFNHSLSQRATGTRAYRQHSARSVGLSGGRGGPRPRAAKSTRRRLFRRGIAGAGLAPVSASDESQENLRRCGGISKLRRQPSQRRFLNASKRSADRDSLQ